MKCAANRNEISDSLGSILGPKLNLVDFCIGMVLEPTMMWLSACFSSNYARAGISY